MQEKFNQQTKLFSERLKLALENYPKSKGELAKKLGVSPVTISRWLGGRVPDTVYASKLADELSVRFNWLIMGDGAMEQIAGMVSEDAAEYGGVKPLIQPVSEAVKRASAADLWERIACTSYGIAQISEPKMRLKISGDLIIMIESAIAKDQKTVREKEL